MENIRELHFQKMQELLSKAMADFFDSGGVRVSKSVYEIGEPASDLQDRMVKVAMAEYRKEYSVNVDNNKFSEMDINYIKEVIFCALDIEVDTDKALEYYNKLPDYIKADFDRWGISDTPTREEAFTWLVENCKKVVTTFSCSQEMQGKTKCDTLCSGCKEYYNSDNY